MHTSVHTFLAPDDCWGWIGTCDDPENHQQQHIDFKLIWNAKTNKIILSKVVSVLFAWSSIFVCFIEPLPQQLVQIDITALNFRHQGWCECKAFFVSSSWSPGLCVFMELSLWMGHCLDGKGLGPLVPVKRNLRATAHKDLDLVCF